MKIYYIRILIIFMFFNLSCNRNNSKIEERFKEFSRKLDIHEDNILFINLDGCPSCTVVYYDYANHFLDSGVVVLISKNSKKAKAFLDVYHPKVVYDQENLSKQLNLSNVMPTVYSQKKDGSIDSLIVGF